MASFERRSVLRAHLPAVVTALLLVPAAARAQPAPAPGTAAAGPAQEGTLVIKPEDAAARKDGLSPGALIAATFNFTNNRNVVGQPDGTSLVLGAQVDGSLEYNRGPHEWRNTLGVAAGVTRTPAIDEYLKTRDALGAESIYLYHVVPVFGPFARIAMNTQMFSGYDIRAGATDYQIAHLDGTTETLTGRRLRLTDPFEPLTLKESLGGFVQPVTTERIRLELRAGLGAQEVLAKEALAVNDDETTAGVTEVKELDSFNQLGIEAVGNAWGTIDQAKRIAYTVGLGILIPLAHTALPAGDDRNALELTNVELTAGLSVKLVDWASLDYKLSVLRQPQLIDETQVMNNLLFTIGLGLGSKAPVPPAPPPCVEAKPPAEPTPQPAAPAPAPAPAPAKPPPAETAPPIPPAPPAPTPEPAPAPPVAPP